MKWRALEQMREAWISRWLRATVPVSSEPLFRVRVSQCEAVECSVAPRPMRR